MLIENHAHYTGSTVARRILDNWATMLPKFRKIMPTEYRKALEEIARREADEGDLPAVVAGE
jgi:glutamate synthase (NADPH/NADH) large chain